MKIKIYLIIVFQLFFQNVLKSQNLLLNGSFEEISSCPIGLIDNSANFWQTPINHLGTANHFHACYNTSSSGWGIPSNYGGVQDTCDGISYAGSVVYSVSGDNPNLAFREYITGQFSQTLEDNKCYKVSFSYSLAEKHSQYAISNYGLYFSDQVPVYISADPDNYVLNNQPQVKINQYLNNTEDWVNIERFYLALGGESYVTFGNFDKNINTDTLFVNPRNVGVGFFEYTSYIYIDKIVVEEVPLLSFDGFSLGNDTALCLGESITLTPSLPDNSILVWNKLNNDSSVVIDSTNQYILEVYNNCSYTSDTINIEFLDPEVKLDDEIIACKREEVVLKSKVLKNSKIQYSWYKDSDLISNDFKLFPQDSGLYELVAKAGLCEDRDSIKVIYHVPEDAKIISRNIDTFLCVNASLGADSTIWNEKYLWNTGDTSQFITVIKSGLYEVYTENECTESKSFFNVIAETPLGGLNNYNIFSPNDDFTNDLFTIYQGYSEDYQIQIFNRWGKLVWESDEPKDYWSANGYVDGTYFYFLTYRNCAGVMVEQKGDVEVRR